MKVIQSNKGMTLIEIVIAIGITSIIFIAVLNLFSYGYFVMNTSGIRTNKLFDLQTVVEDLNVKSFNGYFINMSSIEDYLNGSGAGYDFKQVSNIDDLEIRYDKEVNVFISEKTINGNVEGYEVIMVKFVRDNELYKAKVTSFVIKGEQYD